MQMTLTTLMQSKKFLAAALAAVISFFAIREGMTSEQIAFVVGPLIAFIAAQGVADFGKESSLVETKAYAKEKEADALAAKTATQMPNNLTSDDRVLSAIKQNAPRIKEILS